MKELEANLVIIGGGGAGIAAALTAVERGITSVVVLEKRLATGGCSAMAGGFLFAAESPPQKRAGSGFLRGDAFKETMAFHHYDRVNARILRAFINKSGDTIRWLEENGIEYVWTEGVHKVHQLRDLSKPVGEFGAKLKILTEKCKKGGVQILLRTSVKKILRSPEWKITSVIATDKEGEEVRVNTKSVILTTGGFTGNPEQLRKYCPFYYDEDVYDTGWGAMLSNTGEGIQLAEEAGAGIYDYATLIREPIGVPRNSQPARRSTDSGTDASTTLSGLGRLAADPRSVWVNKRGKRFLDETHGYQDECTNAVLWQPGKIAYALYDDKMVERIMEPDPDPSPGLNITPEQHIDNLREAFQGAAKNGFLAKVSATWAGIAEWIGADPGVLELTIDEYNSFCDRGYDELFVKDKRYLITLRQPPYYAAKFAPMMIDIAGPAKINEHMEVLDNQDKPIPGLFAAGVIAGGWQGYDYHNFGSALSWALNSGRIAGESAIEYISNKT